MYFVFNILMFKKFFRGKVGVCLGLVFLKLCSHLLA